MKNINGKLIYDNAKSFEDAANILLKKSQEDMLNSNKQTFTFNAIPFIVNLSFSVELYIKAILAYENTTMRGHKTELLFDKLENETKETFIKTEPKIRDFLEQTSKYFEEWRYPYEEKNLKAESEILTKITKIFKQHIEQKYLYEA